LDQLQIHELTGANAAELYLLIDFDDQQRLKKITLPDLLGKSSLNI